MSKIVTVIREYDDKGELTAETETTKVITSPENRRVYFGFGMPPLELKAEEDA